MSGATMTEAEFLLSELRYTLAQLRMQYASVLSEEAADLGLRRRLEQIVSQMSEYEREYHARYVELLDLPPNDNLDLRHADARTHFVDGRVHTIQTLEGSMEASRPDVLEVLRRHVADDRKHMTEIADQRPEVRRRTAQDKTSA